MSGDAGEVFHMTRNQMLAVCAALTSWDGHIAPGAWSEYGSRMTRGADVGASCAGVRDYLDRVLAHIDG